ncbi:MAG: MFS transporter [Clostridia bacterium]|nr:MFS transporter [Clostridia bacterium]
MKNKERTTRVAFVLVEGFEYFITLFVTGTMLGYLLDTVGFSDSLQGIIGTVSTFACGAQLFALFLSGKRVKRICTVTNVINQLGFVILYLFPLFNLSANIKTALLLILLIGGHLLNNAIRPSKLTMFMDSVPLDARGSFTAVKEMISLAGGIVVSLVMGRVADTYRDTDGLPTREYYLICAAALLLMTLIHTASMLISTEKTKVSENRPRLCDTIKRISKNKNFIKVVVVGLLWNMASAFSTSFFASYQREELAFSFTLIAVLSTVSAISRILASPVLGKIADKYSFATSMTVGFYLAAIGFLAVVFTAPQTRWLYIAYSCFYGFAMAAINSGVINLVYDYVDGEDRAAAMGVKNALGGVLAFLTALLSGAIMAAIQSAGGFRILSFNLYAQQILSLLSVVVILILILYMRLVIAPLHRVEDVESAAKEHKNLDK